MVSLCSHISEMAKPNDGSRIHYWTSRYVVSSRVYVGVVLTTPTDKTIRIDITLILQLVVQMTFRRRALCYLDSPVTTYKAQGKDHPTRSYFYDHVSL